VEAVQTVREALTLTYRIADVYPFGESPEDLQARVLRVWKALGLPGQQGTDEPPTPTERKTVR
jgi:hypothetical protein